MTYSLASTGDHASFEINSNGQIKTKTGVSHDFDFESAKKSYSVTVQVSDEKDAANDDDTVVDDTIAVTINLTDANDAPTIDSGSSAFSKDENTATSVVIQTYQASDEDVPADTLSWSLVNTGDASDFTITKNSSGHGELKFDRVPDYEDPADNGTNNVYNVTVKVTDNGMGNLSASQPITITINNVNEAPTITSTGMGFTAPSFMEIEYDATSPDLSVVTYTATDPDTQTGNTLTWSKTGGDAGDFDINSNTGELRFKNAPNFEDPEDGNTNNDYNINVKVRDNGIPGSRAGNELEDTITVTVTVTDVNERPDIDEDFDPPQNYMELEYDATGTRPDVHTFSAEDYDDGDTFTWSLGGQDSDHLDIGLNSGVLIFNQSSMDCQNDGPLPDFEEPCDGSTGGTNTYNINVIATDNHSKAETYAVTVSVTNVDETPEFTNPPADRDFEEIEYDFDGTPDLVVATFTARDEEMENITWTLAPGGDSDDLSITENSSGEGVVTFDSDPNFEMSTGSGTPNNVYEFTVVITDATAAPNTDANERTLDYAVTVTDVNERPDIMDDIVPDYMEVNFYFTGTPSSVHTFTATDDDNTDNVDLQTIDWTLDGDDAGAFSIDSSTGELTFVQDASLNVGPLPSYEDPQDQGGNNTYEITVVATDDDTNDEKAGRYDVVINVTDEEEEGRVTASLPNDPPLVGDVLTFTLSDPDGGIVLTSGDIDWTIQARNPGGTEQDWVSIDDTDPLSLVKTYTVDEDYTGKEIRATVEYEDRYDVENMDSSNRVSSDDTNSVLDRRAVAPPRFREGASQTIPEGEAGRDTDVEIMATDRDGEVLIFGIQDGQDSDLFEIIPSDSTVSRTIQNVDYTGYAARLRAIEALDYETVTSRSSTCPSKSLCLTLTLSDGRSESNGQPIYDDTIDVTYDVTIEVTDVEEPGGITFSPEEVPEPGVLITATLADPDGSIGGRSWQWQRSEDPEAEQPVWMNISGETSSTYTPTDADVVSGGDNDGDGYYLRATVTYTDGEGSGKSAEAIAGQVGTANSRPQFPSAETGQRSVPENSRSGTNIGDPVAAEDPENNSLTYSLSELSESLDDSEAFTIVSNTGQLRVKEPLDFENGQTQYIFNVDVHDRRDAAGRSSSYIDDTHLVIITVENEDEEGTVALTTVTNRIQATVEITTELNDPDESLSSITWQWARSSNRSDWTDITTGATYIPTAADDQGNYLRATASYTDGHGSDKTAKIVTSRVASPPPANAAPVFPDSEDGQREVREGAGNGTAVVGPIQATDFDSADTLIYSLSGSDSSLFTIDTSGQLRLQLEQDEALDYERKRTYRFTVRVSDGKNDDGVPDDPDNLRIDDSISVTVSLIDVNEAPVITGEAEREFRENSTSAVATYSARDPEGDSITWSVAGADADSFVITDRG